jgi:hypothetical protein
MERKVIESELKARFEMLSLHIVADTQCCFPYADKIVEALVRLWLLIIAVSMAIDSIRKEVRVSQTFVVVIVVRSGLMSVIGACYG